MKTVLEAKDLCKYYGSGENRVKAVDHVNLEIPRGIFLSIVGKSGSGKSTLLHLLGALDTPTSGEIRINDKKISDFSEEELAVIRRREIGFIFQDFNLVPSLTVWENIVLPLGLDHRRVDEKYVADIIKTLGMEGKTGNLPNTLSGGQQQRTAIARAIAAEKKRQIEVLESGGKVIQETRRWDDAAGKSYAMRSKEDAQDYRYFPEPDLAPVVISEEWKEEIRAGLPMLPKERKQKYIEECGLSEYDARLITEIKALADYFDEVNDIVNNPKEVANWLLGDFMRLAKEGEEDCFNIFLDASKLAEIILMLKENLINRNTAKDVFAAVWKENLDPRKYVEEHDLAMVGDDNLVKDTVEKVLAANPKTIEEYKSGKTKVLGFLVGQCMKELKGKADPGTINALLRDALK